MVCLLVLAPLTLGAAGSRGQTALLCLVAAMLGATAWRWFSGVDGFRWTWAYVPIALVLVWNLVQIVPLPADVVRAISPARLDWHGGTPHGWLTLSVDPSATAGHLRLAIAVASVLVVVVNVWHTNSQIRRLLGMVAAVGAAASVLTLVQVICGTHGFSRILDADQAPTIGGLFLAAGRNSQFIAASTAAAGALALVELAELAPPVSSSPAQWMERLTSRDSLRWWLLVAAVALGLGNAFITFSRLAGLALLAAAGVTAAVGIIGRAVRHGSGVGTAVMAMGSILTVFYVGFGAVHRNCSILIDAQPPCQLSVANLAHSSRFALTGTGLGTGEDSNLSTASLDSLYSLAVREGGLTTLVPLALLAAIVSAACLKALRHRQQMHRLAALSLGGGLLGLATMNLADASARLPANAVLIAVFSGLLLNLAGPTQGRRQPARKSQRLAPAMAMAALAPLWAWSLSTAMATLPLGDTAQTAMGLLQNLLAGTIHF